MESVGKWRKFFESAEADICTVIDHAILVANSDCPREFMKRRDKIKERLDTATSLSQHQYKSSWREVAVEGIKSTGNVATTETSGMQEVPETEQPEYLKVDSNHCSKHMENIRNGVLKMDAQNCSDREHQCNKYKAIRIGPMKLRLQIIRQKQNCMSYEENLQKKLELKSTSLPFQHKLNCKRDDKSVKGKIEATKKRFQEMYQRAEEAKKQRRVQVIELQDLPSFKALKPIRTRIEGSDF